MGPSKVGGDTGGLSLEPKGSVLNISICGMFILLSLAVTLAGSLLEATFAVRRWENGQWIACSHPCGILAGSLRELARQHTGDSIMK